MRRTAGTALAAVVVAALAVVGGGPTPVGAAIGSCTLTWTGAGGDGSWMTVANWSPQTGAPRTPAPTDVVCATGGAPSATVDGAFSVADLRWDQLPAVPLVVRQSLAIAGEGTVRSLRLEGTAVVHGAGMLTADATTVPASAEQVVVWPGTGFVSRGLAVAGTLLLPGRVALQGATTVAAGGALRLGDPDDDGISPPSVGLQGTLDLRAGGSFTNPGPITFVASEGARILGPPPTLRRARIHLHGPVAVTATQASVAGAIGEGATLRAVPDPVAPGFDLDVLNLAPVEGTLRLDGVPGSIVLVNGQGASIENDGVVHADHALVYATIRNRGLVRAGTETLFTYHRDTTQPHRNGGFLVLDGAAAFGGDFENTGVIGTDGPAGELLVDGVLDVGGVVEAPVRTISNGAVRAKQGVQVAVRRLDLTGAGNPGIWVDGVTSSTAGTVRSASTVTADDSMIPSFSDVGFGYAPCSGDRFPIVTSRGLLVDGRISPDGPPQHGSGPVDGGQVAFRYRSWGIVGIVGVTGAPSARCRSLVGGRYTLLVHVEGLRRLPTDAELLRHQGRATSYEGQVAVARTLLGSVEAARVLVDQEYGRTTGRPADPGGLTYWSQRLASGTSPRTLRAQLLGSAAFLQRAGGTTAGFADALYRSELGRPVDAAGRAWVESRLAAGGTRSQVAFALLATGEAQRALAGRMITRWWGRDATPAERATWGSRFASAPSERDAVSRLAAVAPHT